MIIRWSSNNDNWSNNKDGQRWDLLYTNRPPRIISITAKSLPRWVRSSDEIREATNEASLQNLTAQVLRRRAQGSKEPTEVENLLPSINRRNKSGDTKGTYHYRRKGFMRIHRRKDISGVAKYWRESWWWIKTFPEGSSRSLYLLLPSHQKIITSIQSCCNKTDRVILAGHSPEWRNTSAHTRKNFHT